MDKTWLYSLPCLLLAACSADAPEKYRDIHHLEFPPTLAIERTGNRQAGGESVGGYQNRTEGSSDSAADNSGNPQLNKLIQLIDADTKPVLRLKTRFERAWDLVDHGLNVAEIEIIDKKYDDGLIRVSYVAAYQANKKAPFKSIREFFTDNSEGTQYNLTLDKGKRTTDVHVVKLIPADKDSSYKDESASLMKLLHDTIIADLDKN